MEEQAIPQQLERVLSKSCPQCGAQMAYDAKHLKMNCDNCGHKEDPPQSADLVVERDFTEALNLNDAPTGLNVQTKEFHCNNCGANTMVPPDTVAFSCPFCASNNVNEEAHQHRIITPSGILPFAVEKKVANLKFKEWIGKGWWYPGKLGKLARLDKMEGVYLPFWTYDADTDSSWTADAGYYYYETVSFTDSSGNRQTRQEQRVRWVPASGYYQHWFDDVTVVGSQGVPQRRVERVYPYDLKKVVNYDTQYILGWKSEVYQKDVKEGFGMAEGIMNGYIRTEIIKQIPGDTHRNLHINTHKHDITFKHLLLPMYIAAYQYNNKSFQVLVNGQTGKISGQKPLSWMKITLAVLTVVAVAVGIYFLTRK
ncbi:MAG: hypothetical protein KF690_08555 [Bacteroidetes bacterium]|nr:hypothetical protein [Bacteroidota bacterium]